MINSEYKYSAQNNTIRYEAQSAVRGLIYDRDSTLLVDNIRSSDLMVIPREVNGKLDTLKLCNLINIDKKTFRKRLQDAKDFSS